MSFKTKLALLLSTLLSLFSCAATNTKLPSPLDNTAWILERHNEQILRLEKPITLEFTPESAKGFGSCNQFKAPYTATTDNRLNFGRIAASKKLCPKIAPSVEYQFFDSLRKVKTYRLEKNNLILEGTDSYLEFRRQVS